jgi:transcriptional regulator with GAF, ATPase, and Fis domain
MSEFEGLSTRVIAREHALQLLSVELVVIDGPDRGKRLRVAQGSARVGTSRTSQLTLADPTVSRLHCEITVHPDGIALRDRGSTNGTFVDGVRVRDADLTAGAMVRVGSSTFRVEVGDEPAFVELSSRTSFGDVVGGSAEMRRVYAIMEKVAPTDTTVLVSGETGTGKDLVARALHECSRRAAGPFMAIDCGAIPENLFESELFGHVRGAFSGASFDRKGVFEEADGGTLFFDEIGELPLTMQPKLLRALESRQVRRVGSNMAKPVDVRVVAATNRSLARSVNDGSFREDLYYRLAVIEIELPPLRARRHDIPSLAEHFLERFTGAATTAPPELLSTLLTRAWPGNVRELRNFIERTVSLGIQRPSRPPPPPSSRDSLGAPSSSQPAMPAGLGALVPVNLPLKEARLAWTEQFENVYVRALLDKTGGNVTRAAELAGVNRRFLQRMMARLGIRSADVGDED